MAAEEKAPAEEAKGAEGAPAPAKASNMGTIILVVVCLLVMTVTPVTTFFLMKNAAPAPVEKVPEPPKAGAPSGFKLDTVTVNIAQTKGTRMLSFEPYLVVSELRLVEELKANYKEMLLDRMIAAARRKTIDELEGDTGRETLKREIMGEINAAIKDKLAGAVTDVFFSKFVIQ